VCAIFNYGIRPSTYGLASNPATHADRRAEPQRAPLAFDSPEQVEALAQSLATGAHRDPSRPALGDDEIAARVREDVQDAELVRVASYAGLRRGELVALRWRDVDFAGHKIIVRRMLSGETEVKSTKSRRVREVPLADQAAIALERLSRRKEFTAPDDYVFVGRLGRRLDPSALRRRFERARDAAGLDRLRFHDLRHTYGSLLIAGGIDLVSVKPPWATRGSRRPSATCTPGPLGNWRIASRGRWLDLPFCRSSHVPLNQRGWIKQLEAEGWTRERGGKHVVKMTKEGQRPITLRGW